MNSADKIMKLIDYLINIRYFATTISSKVRNDLNGNNVSCGESIYLILLGQYQNGLTMSELSTIVKVDKSLTTRTIKKLLEKDYIYRDTDDLTARKYKIKLTKIGMKKANIINQLLIDNCDMFINKLTDKELKVLESAFSILNNKL